METVLEKDICTAQTCQPSTDDADMWYLAMLSILLRT